MKFLQCMAVGSLGLGLILTLADQGNAQLRWQNSGGRVAPAGTRSAQPRLARRTSAGYQMVGNQMVGPAIPRQTATVVYDDGPLLDSDEVIIEGTFPEVIPMPEGQVMGGACESGCGSPDCGECFDCPMPCGPFGERGLLGRAFGCGNLSLFAGVQGFKGLVDNGRNGNFGFHEGINWGAALGGPAGIGYQIGFQAVHSSFEGSEAPAAGAPVYTGSRDQVFFTAAVFRRAVCCGLQWGVAFDMMHDSYYYDSSANLDQMRIELSYLGPYGGEIGFWGAIGTGSEDVTDRNVALGTMTPTDLFAFFIRTPLANEGQLRGWAGFTGEGDGLLGGDFSIAIGPKWAVESNFNYLIPSQSSDSGGREAESWNVMLQLVWYPGRRGGQASPYRPMFGVADNSSFLVNLP